MVDTGYISHAMFQGEQGRADLIDSMVNRIGHTGLEFNTIAFSGVSGAIMAPLIADRLNKKLTVIRKPPEQERAHSYRSVEGWCDQNSKYIIVDDFIDSGDTIRRIWKAMCRRNAGRCVGIFLYCGFNAASFYAEQLTEFVVNVWDRAGGISQFDLGYDPDR